MRFAFYWTSEHFYEERVFEGAETTRAEEGEAGAQEASGRRDHRGALPRSFAAQAACSRGRYVASGSTLGSAIMRSVYVMSLVVGMVAWIWALTTGIVWIFGA